MKFLKAISLMIWFFAFFAFCVEGSKLPDRQSKTCFNDDSDIDRFDDFLDLLESIYDSGYGPPLMRRFIYKFLRMVDDNISYGFKRNPLNVNLTEFYHDNVNGRRESVSVYFNNIADKLASGILEQKKSRQNHPSPYKYTKIFSKTDYRAPWLLTITQVSDKFFSIVNQFNIFFNGGNLTDDQIQELNNMGTPEMKFIKELSTLKNEIHAIEDDGVEKNLFANYLSQIYSYVLKKLYSIEDDEEEEIMEEIINYFEYNKAKLKENVVEGFECYLDLAIEFGLVPSDKKEEFLKTIESYYNRLHSTNKELFIEYSQKIQAVVNNYFWKEMPEDILSEKVYKIFHKISRLLINLDVNGLVRSIEGFNKMIDEVSWKVLNGELPAFTKVIDNFLRRSMATESVWINLDQRRQQFKAFLGEKVVMVVKNSGFTILPTHLHKLESILTDNDAFKNQMEKIFSNLDTILKNFDNFKEAFYLERFHCAACNDYLIDDEGDGYINLGGLFQYFNLWFLIENWESTAPDGYDYEDENEYLTNLVASNANILIISLYGNCAASFKTRPFDDSYNC